MSEKPKSIDDIFPVEAVDIDEAALRVNAEGSMTISQAMRMNNKRLLWLSIVIAEGVAFGSILFLILNYYASRRTTATCDPFLWLFIAILGGFWLYAITKWR